MPNDHDLCESVCFTAKRLGYLLRETKSPLGYSYAFISATARPTCGTVDPDRKAALTAACKELYPLIASEI